MASASDAASRRVSARNRWKSYCVRRCVRLSTTWLDTFLGAPVRAGAFLFPECCYRRSRRRLVGSLLDECLLDAVTGLAAPAGGSTAGAWLSAASCTTSARCSRLLRGCQRR